MSYKTRVFISYSHLDEPKTKIGIKWLSELKTQLRLIQIAPEHEIVAWDDTKIKVGSAWQDDIKNELENAQIVIMLISNNYLVSEFIKDNEFLPALEKAAKDGTIIFPIYITDTTDLPDRLRRIQGATDPEHPIRKGGKSDRDKEWKKVMHKLKDSVALTLSLVNAVNNREDNHINEKKRRKIHILTGLKGGIGKTMVGLSIVCSYCDTELLLTEHKLIAMDMNTMNQDMFNILEFETPAPLEDLATWWKSDIHEKCTTVRLQSPHPNYLLNGSPAFWKSLTDITKLFAETYDIMVDANVHPASIVDQSAQPALCELLENDQCDIYVWIFWPWAGFGKKVRGTVANIQTDIPEQYKDRVSFVHVLNPSAMAQPEVDVAQIKYLIKNATDTNKYIAASLDALTGLEKEFSEKQGNTQKQDRIANLLKDQHRVIDAFKESLDGYLNSLIALLHTIQPFKGLEVLTDVKCDESITLQHFTQKMGDALELLRHEFLKNPMATDFTKLAAMIKNDLPCYTLVFPNYDPNLRGYTDQLQLSDDRTLDSIRDKITTVYKPVCVFLHQLYKAKA